MNCSACSSMGFCTFGADHATNEEREEMLLLQEKILGHLEE